ncbi:hypothetical protein AAY473_016962 [Plecturocebus cupreus]
MKTQQNTFAFSFAITLLVLETRGPSSGLNLAVGFLKDSCWCLLWKETSSHHISNPIEYQVLVTECWKVLGSAGSPQLFPPGFPPNSEPCGDPDATLTWESERSIFQAPYTQLLFIQTH